MSSIGAIANHAANCGEISLWHIIAGFDGELNQIFIKSIIIIHNYMYIILFIFREIFRIKWFVWKKGMKYIIIKYCFIYWLVFLYHRIYCWTESYITIICTITKMT